MASLSRGVYVAFMMVIFVMKCVSISCISSTEFDSMVDTLRVRGYDLFCNAIVTSDLQFDLLSYQTQQQQQHNNNNTITSFTFFAPTDASLFALDMTQTASSYTDTLRYHVVPRRLTLPQLRFLPDGYSLPTLLPNRRLQLTRRPIVAVGGVDIAFPGLFYGREIAVHGLAGILSLRSSVVNEVASHPPSPAPVVPPIRSADRRNFTPRNSPNSRENQTVPKFASFNVTRWRGSSTPVEAPAPGPTAVTRHAAAAASPVNGIVHAPKPEPYRRFHAPAVSPQRFPDSAISSAPVGVGYSEAAVPAPVGVDLWVGKKDRVWLMETLTDSKSETLDGIRKCVSSEDNIGHMQMQCYAA